MQKGAPKAYEVDGFDDSSLQSGENTPFSDECPYETHTVLLTRSPGFGFGFALSGGVDEPAFENGGDKTVYVSDVLRGGPADGRLRLFDRILSVNGISLAGVENASAVDILRDAGSVVSLLVQRRQSGILNETQLNGGGMHKVSLTRKGKSCDFGLVLGVRLYVKSIIPNSIAANAKYRLHEGDILTRLNDVSTEDLTLNEARKIVENSRDRLDLTVLPASSAKNRCELSADNNSNVNDGLQHETNSVASWSLSSLNNKTNNNLKNGYGSNNNGVSQNNRNNAVGSLENGITEGKSSCSGGEETARVVSFCKDGSVGIRLIGGNRSGVYIADVQHGSVAASAGLTSGDHILSVNDFNYRSLSREEAVMHLLQTGRVVNMVVEHKPENMAQLLAEGADGMTGSGGDSFYVRANYDYSPGVNSEPGQLMFRSGDILHVTDTLYNGTIGCWFAARLSHNNMEVERGIIPNQTRGEQIKIIQQRQAAAIAAESSNGNHTSAFGTLDRASAKLFGRTKPRRAKSLSRDYWESVSNGSGRQQVPEDNTGRKENGLSTTDKRPAYERVRLVEPGSEFRRPVVVYGPVGDLARHRLTTEFPAVFESPVGEPNQQVNGTCSSKVIRLRAIRQVMERSRHAVLDITPNSVDKLVDAGFHPIVVYVKCNADQRQFIKDAQQRSGWHSTKTTKKLLSEAQRLESSYSRLFSASVQLTPSDQWFVRLRQAIELSQNTAIWVPDTSNHQNSRAMEMPQINGNAFITPSSNASVTGDDNDDSEDIGHPENSSGWKQAHPFATIRHMSKHPSKAQPSRSSKLSRGSGSTVSSSAIMSTIDTPGSYATLPSRRALPLPPPPPPVPNGVEVNNSNLSTTTPVSKTQQQQRTPSEYANFATLRTPPNSAAIAVPPVISILQDTQESPPELQLESMAMMASTASTVIEHGVISTQSIAEQQYRRLAVIGSPQLGTNGVNQAQNNDTSPQSQDGGRVYPSFYADEQLSNDQKQTINTYGTLSRHRQGSGRKTERSPLAQTDFRSPIIEAKEFETDFKANRTKISEELEIPVSGRVPNSAPAVTSAPTVLGNYAPLSNARSNSSNNSPMTENMSRLSVSDQKSHYSPLPERMSLINQQNPQTPPSPASSNRYASLHLMPRPYRKNPNQFHLLQGEAEGCNGEAVEGSSSSAVNVGKTLERQVEQSPRISSLRPNGQHQSRGMWLNSDRQSNQQNQQLQQTQQQQQQQESHQKTDSPSSGHPAVSTDPLVLDTVRASVDYAGGILESKATGVSLNIPRSALPPVVRQEVYFRVCSEPGAIAALQQLPNATAQEHGITPVVMCGPPGLVFRRQVELRLPRAVRLRLSNSSQPPICYGPVDADQIMSVFIDHF